MSKQIFGLRLVERGLDALRTQLFECLAQFVDAGAQHRTGARLLGIKRAQLRRSETRGGECLTRDVHTAREMHTDRADHVAASALRAGIEHQLLPLLELGETQVARQQLMDQPQRTELAPIDLAQELQLVDWSVAALARALVKVARLGAHSAMQAGLEVKGHTGVGLLE